jgi:hypothetical protein
MRGRGLKLHHLALKLQCDEQCRAKTIRRTLLASLGASSRDR